MVVFVDECGFSNQPVVRRTWARCGQTPVIQYESNRRRLSAIGAICLTPWGHLQEHFQIQRRGIKDDDLFWFLFELRQHYRRPLIVVWDNWSVHGKVERAYRYLEVPWIHFERFPPYSPELNPVEFSWSQTKYHDLGNYVPPADDQQWIDDINLSFEKINKQDNLLQSFFEGAGLALN